MQSKLILALALASMVSIGQAGNGNSKSDPQLKIPSAGALRDRALALSLSVDTLTRMGIFDTFANKEMLESEIPQHVDDALDACWAEHIRTIKRQTTPQEFPKEQTIPIVPVQLIEQGQDYEKQRAILKPMIIKILLTKDREQKNLQRSIQ